MTLFMKMMPRTCLVCENKDLFGRILLCQPNLQQPVPTKIPTERIFLFNFDKLSKRLQIFENRPTFNLFPEIFAIDIPLFCTSSILNQINCRDNSLAIVGNWIRLLGINAPRLQGGRMANTFANLSNFIFWPRLPSFLNRDLLKLFHDLIDGVFQETA